MQFTSDPGTGQSEVNQGLEGQSSQDNVLRTKPAMKFLSDEERQRDEEELRRVEQERREREHHGDIVDLEPLPTQVVEDAVGNAGDILARTDSQQPLLQASSGFQNTRRDSIGDSINA